jgi:hypothetical protein
MKKPNGDRLTAEEARSLLDAVYPIDGQTVEQENRDVAAWTHVQLAMIHGRHSKELAEANAAMWTHPEDDGAHANFLACLRTIVEEEAPELLEQFDEEAAEGQFRPT